jgi:hypothetical protein
VEKHEFDLDLAALLDDGEPSVAGEVLAHLRDCGQCQDRLAAHRRIAQTLQSLKRHPAPAQLDLESVLVQLDPEAAAAGANRLFRAAPRLAAPATLGPPAWRTLRKSRPRVLSLRLRPWSAALLAASLAVAIGLALWPRSRFTPPIRVTIVSMTDADIAALSKRTRDALAVYAPAVSLGEDAR